MSWPPGGRTPPPTAKWPGSGHGAGGRGTGSGGTAKTAGRRPAGAAGAVAGLGRRSCTACAMALMCAGVVPQHPPTSVAPLATNRRGAPRKDSGVGAERGDLERGERGGRRARFLAAQGPAVVPEGELGDDRQVALGERDGRGL